VHIWCVPLLAGTLEAKGDTRLGFLKKAGVAGGALVGGGALLGALAPTAMAGTGTGRPPSRFGSGDIGILNYALTLEYLERDFYNEAAKNDRRKSFLGKDGKSFLTAVIRAGEHRRRRVLRAAVQHRRSTSRSAPIRC
jgi:ferritin-like protein